MLRAVPSTMRTALASCVALVSGSLRFAISCKSATVTCYKHERKHTCTQCFQSSELNKGSGSTPAALHQQLQMQEPNALQPAVSHTWLCILRLLNFRCKYHLQVNHLQLALQLIGINNSA